MLNVEVPTPHRRFHGTGEARIEHGGVVRGLHHSSFDIQHSFLRSPVPGPLRPRTACAGTTGYGEQHEYPEKGRWHRAQVFNLINGFWLLDPPHGTPVPNHDVCSRNHDKVASIEGIFHDALDGPVGSDIAAN